MNTHVVLWQIPTIAHTHLPDITNTDMLNKTDVLIERLRDVCQRFSSVVLASSLAAEDMLLLDIIVKHHLPISIFTLETGRLPTETLELLARAEKHYGLSITRFYPNQNDIDTFEADYGKWPMYDSLDLRKECCRLRKLVPLKKALNHADAWVTGLRQAQSTTRTAISFEEHEPLEHRQKFNPLFDWRENDVWAYVLQNKVPFNTLYTQGYPSIGCEPCTRPIKETEDIRAGRWWWEDKENKECGLHIK